MRKWIRALLCLVVTLLMGHLAPLHAQAPHIGQNLASLVYLDGRNVTENATFNLENDQLLSLETYDLLPNSQVELNAQQKGIVVVKKVYQTDEKGAMKDILFFPKARGTIRCVLTIHTIDGVEKRVVFHLRPV